MKSLALGILYLLFPIFTQAQPTLNVEAPGGGAGRVAWDDSSDEWRLYYSFDLEVNSWAGFPVHLITEKGDSKSSTFTFTSNAVFLRLSTPSQFLADFVANLPTSDQVQQSQTGLYYEIVREGTGISPDGNDQVVVHYEGAFLNGTVFDSSYARNQTSQFGVAGVIAGFAEGLQLMKEGGEIRIYIPYELAYGASGSGSIPPYTPIQFRVELFEVIQL